MKKTSLLGLLLLAFMPLFAEHVDPETARKVATTFLSNNGAKADQLTDLSKSAGFPNLYIFTTEESFVVMAADDCVKPILGYSLTNDFVVEDMPENISSWLQGNNDGIQRTIDNGVKSTAAINQAWKDLANGKAGVSEATPIVDALLQTKWDQGSPYNKLCPKKGNTRTVTGCVATAMAQIMKYWNHPTTGTGNHSYSWNSTTLSADFGATTYDWANMTNTYNSSSSNTENTAVATLMYHCGVSVDMKYNTSGSNASTYDVMSALQTYFSYAPVMQYKSKDDYGDEVWITMLKRELNQGRPLQYRGSDAGGNGGHSFVCDGYDSDDNFHFNWGWGGNCDGFYSVNDMEPGTGGIGAGNGVYTVGESAIFGIEPISSLTAPTISASTDQGIVTLTWDAVAGADSYDVYKDNVKVADGIVNTDFTDSDITFGTEYEYYVRAVFADERSNPSNHVMIKSLYRDIKPSNLDITVSSNNATLTWVSPSDHSSDLHYSINYQQFQYGMGPAGKDTYWTEVFSPTILNDYAGMFIHKVSAYLVLSGDYKLFLFEEDPSDESNKLLEQSFTVSSSGWKDIEISTPFVLDHTKDLWVILFYPYNEDQDFWYPAAYGTYDAILWDDETNPDCHNPRLIGESLSSDWYYIGDNISWLMRTYLTDGTYTYNLYDGNTKVNDSPIPTTNYTLENIGNGIHQYTVKTNFNGGESEASNVMGVTIGANNLATLNLSGDNQMTITDGSTLTVGTLTNSDPANLVLENGAQLITNSEDVKATVKRNITTFTGANDKGNWHLIASPMTDEFLVSETCLPSTTISNYDLYIFDQNHEGQEWRNYKGTGEGHFTTIKNKVGYLYASAENTSVSFAGTLNNTDGEVGITFTDEKPLSGYNLVGNPFPCEATIDKTDYYRIVETEEGSKLQLASSYIAPLEGIIVKAADGDETVTFSKATAKASRMSSGMVALNVSRERGQVLDNARIRLEGNLNMEKINLHQDGTQLFIPQDGKDYALVINDGQTAIPVSFKASQDGIYTLDIETEGLDLDYLHLIDNIAGADIDLLTTTSYTFEAKNDDYTSRFRLLFSAIDEDQTDELVEGDIQILDVTGRVVRTYHGNMRCVPSEGMTPGVYILHSVNGNETKTEKIIIK